jgi:hypothetical protein
MRGFDPRLFRRLAVGLAAGVLAGAATLAGLLWTDVGGLGAKALGGRHGWLPLAMLSWAFAITFGSAGMGIAIHRLGRPDASEAPRPAAPARGLRRPRLAAAIRRPEASAAAARPASGERDDRRAEA